MYKRQFNNRVSVTADFFIKNTKDLLLAQEFGKLIRKKLESETYSHDIEVKGNFPYKADMPKMVFAPTPNEKDVYKRQTLTKNHFLNISFN